MAMGDGFGNVLALVADDQDANGSLLPAGSFYTTGYAVSGVCGGTAFYDKPFSKRGHSKSDP
jgi:hypothetical protein